CNRDIKFRAFLDYALDRGADFIATGHYARVRQSDGICHLLRAHDQDKDQTYFLYLLDQGQLGRSLFPLGGLTKERVRELARGAGLPNYRKKDSTGICFIGERRFSDFLRRYLPARPGPMVSEDGEILGEHQGLMYYTLGQRKGLGLGGRAGAGEAPWFVVAKDLEANRLVVAQGGTHPLLMSAALTAAQLHWIAEPPMPDGETLHCAARIRHRQPLQACRARLSGPAQLRVEFNRPQRAVTPGQSVVLYQGDECLGGGIIEQAGRPGAHP
ncbi:MAG: tRNA 2-thiouridine(34) synthase MnmA, partial [Chromatiales bacterium]